MGTNCFEEQEGYSFKGKSHYIATILIQPDQSKFRKANIHHFGELLFPSIRSVGTETQGSSVVIEDLVREGKP